MGSAQISRLSLATGVAPAVIEALGELEDAQYAVLRESFERARATRARELNRAIGNGLTMLPALVRPVARRVLFS
ncbi:hypothetical protein ABIA39_005532 [Nocardia sp. GAS34]|uniref:hypothetical protein n=1 Tax=unclassified Nocardia TaxID=2637762 RepID=UPI003D1EE2D7